MESIDDKVIDTKPDVDEFDLKEQPIKPCDLGKETEGGSQNLQRKLRSRHLQMIAIGTSQFMHT